MFVVGSSFSAFSIVSPVSRINTHARAPVPALPRPSQIALALIPPGYRFCRPEAWEPQGPAASAAALDDQRQPGAPRSEAERCVDQDHRRAVAFGVIADLLIALRTSVDVRRWCDTKPALTRCRSAAGRRSPTTRGLALAAGAARSR